MQLVELTKVYMTRQEDEATHPIAVLATEVKCVTPSDGGARAQVTIPSTTGTGLRTIYIDEPYWRVVEKVNAALS